MIIALPYGSTRPTIDIDETRADVQVARAAEHAPAASWHAAVAAALAAPLECAPLDRHDLHGKSVTIITDDWGRPTPAAEVVPLLLDAVRRAGAADDAITFVTASGMHDPMSSQDLARKLGPDVVERYRCVSHNAGDFEMLRFVGLSAMGTPVWINRYVAEADFVVGLGRVYLHLTHGYEGGYKLILPGVSGFDTILRDHGFNFSADSVPGLHHNPSRAETDAVGRMVGIDFLVNVVVDRHDAPVRAFAGAVEPVHVEAIAFGDREVWGADIAGPVDITVVSPGARGGFDTEVVRRACSVTRPSGHVIVVGDGASDGPLPDWRAGERADDAALEALDRDAFGPALHGLSFGEIVRLHERRDWPLSPREIQWRVKSLRGEFYRRRWLMAAEGRQVVVTADPQAALDAALDRLGGHPRLLVLPDGSATLPKSGVGV
jgi:hypothetical protein